MRELRICYGAGCLVLVNWSLLNGVRQLTLNRGKALTYRVRLHGASQASYGFTAPYLPIYIWILLCTTALLFSVIGTS